MTDELDTQRIGLYPNSRIVIDFPGIKGALSVCRGLDGVPYVERDVAVQGQIFTMKETVPYIEESLTTPLPPHMAVDLEQDAPFIDVLPPFSGHEHEDC